MIPSWLPSILRPDYVWKSRVNFNPSSTMPPTPSPSPQLVQRFWGYIHTYLKAFSIHYCRWLGIPFSHRTKALPFGLLLKWSDGTPLEEVLTTKVCYAAGLPTPYILSYGLHPDTPHAPKSILMTRLPGRVLEQAYESLSPNAKATALSEFKFYLSSIRKWESPWGEQICSITGGPIRSFRVPNHIVGPCETPQDFHNYLLSPARNSLEYPEEEFTSKLQLAKKLQTLQAKRPGVKFTHGDVKHHNFLVDEMGHITGILDWETAGWYPVFWEWTTAIRYLRKGFWWFDFLIESGAGDYKEESESERALTNLTAQSYSGWYSQMPHYQAG